MEKKINILGLKCEGCVANVTKALKKIKGLEVKSHNLIDKSIIVEMKKEVDDEVLKSAINNGKYEVTGITNI